MAELRPGLTGLIYCPDNTMQERLPVNGTSWRVSGANDHHLLLRKYKYALSFIAITIVKIIRQIRSLLYEQGFTIGGARQRLTGEEAREDVNQSQQIVKQIRGELEEILKILRR